MGPPRNNLGYNKDGAARSSPLRISAGDGSVQSSPRVTALESQGSDSTGHSFRLPVPHGLDRASTGAIWRFAHAFQQVL
jgi:hypothetical protein